MSLQRQKLSWALARKIKSSEWDNCRVNMSPKSLASVIERDLENGYWKNDIIVAFDKAIHIAHAAVVDTELKGMNVRSPAAYTIACYRELMKNCKTYSQGEFQSPSSIVFFTPGELEKVRKYLIKTFPSEKKKQHANTQKM